MKTELKTVTEQCQGDCPHCGSNNLDYRDLEIQDDYAWYPFDCQDCKAVGSEGYNLKYDNTEVDVEVEV